MASFFGRLKSNAVSRRVLPSYAIGEQQTAATNSSGDLSSLNASEGFGATSPSIGGSPTKKDANAPQPTPLEKMLVDAGPLRNDGSDKFFGMENFGNTCYCNSILQCLYFSVPFRESVINYPTRSPLEALTAAAATAVPRINTATTQANGQPQSKQKPQAASPTARSPGAPPNQPQKPEDKDSPEYKKKQAMLAGPILSMRYDNAAAYGMSESLFTSLKDIFEGVVVSRSRMGIISPAKFLEVLRKENEMFRTSMHQDAHEFLNLLLNEVVANVEANAKTREANKAINPSGNDSNFEKALAAATPTMLQPTNGTRSPNTTRWVHELFEGTLTSETKCLTCENVSLRDEAFLDLSVDLDQHSSVTSCLRNFSEEEMLCERNKFHCDNCGGLQEAEKRMKIKRLPKILALHLKRFKYTEDLQRLQKLFHRVVYPYHLRLFNTTDDAEDPDRLYELYAVVVHIGGGPYHGHYVAIIKTEDRGWLLFDDEMVEPVDKSYVRNFFGDRPGLACAYVLFYQETTLEAVQKEQEQEGVAASVAASDLAKEGIGLGVRANGAAISTDLQRVHSVTATPVVDVNDERFVSLDHAVTAPQLSNPVPPAMSPVQPAVTTSAVTSPLSTVTSPISPPLSAKKSDVQSKKERAKEEKERKAAEKEKEKAEKQRQKEVQARLRESYKKQEDDLKAALKASEQSKAEEDQRAAAAGGNKENGSPAAGLSGGLNRFRRGSKSISNRLGLKEIQKSANEGDDSVPSANQTPEQKDKKNRFSIRKKPFSTLS